MTSPLEARALQTEPSALGADPDGGDGGETGTLIRRVCAQDEHYKLLGIQRASTDDEMKRAYRKLAMRLHPDKCHLNGAEDAFKKVNAAFAFLSDKQRRAQYDTIAPEPGIGFSGDRHGSAFRGSQVPATATARHFSGKVDPGRAVSGGLAACVWRCRACTPTDYSVCCRVAPSKYSCLCGHKLADHMRVPCAVKRSEESPVHSGSSCSSCACRTYRFHVQQNAWEVRCSCKHKHTDHSPRSAACRSGKTQPCGLV
jgi:DnaJ-class molecular chaperone